MKKFILLLLLCAVSAFAVTTAMTTSYDTCYDSCKKDCTQTNSAEKCVNICVLQCKTQPEPSLVDASQPVITRAMTQGSIATLPVVYTCEEKCKIDYSYCGEKCQDRLEMCVKNCQPQVVPRLTVAVPPVEISCERRCWMTQDECKKYGVDDASCKLKIDSCLRGCNPQPVCDCPPQPVCEYSCETGCGVGYHKCKSAGASNCGKVIVDCLDQCRPVAPPERCEDQCAKIRQVCREQGLTDAQCEPKLRDCVTRCYPQPMPPVAVGVKSEVSREPVPAIAQAEVREPTQQRIPEPMPEKPGVWATIVSFFKG